MGDLPRASIRGSYQGLEVSDVEYTMKGGLAPDDGRATFDPEIINMDAANLRIGNPTLIPWGEGRGAPQMPVDILVLEQTTFAGFPPPPDLGSASSFNTMRDYGTLQIDSEAGTPVTIKGVYLHPDTAQADGMAGAEGKQSVGVRLTDERIFWPDFGEAFGFINMSMTVRGREVDDPKTLTADGKTPHSLGAVLAWLFLHLPGPPAIRNIFGATTGLNPPKNVHLEHDRPFPWVQRLFSQYSLTLRRNTDATYTLRRRRNKSIAPLSGARILTQQRSLERPYPPAAVRVVGAKIARNLSRTAIAVSRGTDGKMYPLDDVIARSGLTTREALEQFTMPDSRRYEKLSPEIRDIAKEDWGKLFQISTAVGYDGNIPHMDLPMEDLAFAVTGPPGRVSVITGGRGGSFRLGTPTSELADGSGEQETRLRPPRVIGQTYEQRFFTAAEFKKYLPSLRTDLSAMLNRFKDELLALETQKAVAEIVINGRRYQSGENYFFLTLAIPEFQEAELTRQAVERQITAKQAEIAEVDKQLGRLDAMVTLSRIRKDYAPEIALWTMRPMRDFPHDAYTLDRKLGVIRMHQPVGVIVPFIAASPEHFSVVAVPTLTVEYGVEHATQTPGDYYSMMVFRRSEIGGLEQERLTGRWPEPSELGKPLLTVGSAIPSVVVKDERLKLYIDREGVEFNGKLCDSAAFKKAVETLSEAHVQVDGAVFYYEGWIDPGDDETIDSITYRHLGGRPVTVVAHNNQYHATPGAGESTKRAQTTVATKVGARRGADSILRVGG